MRCRFLDLPTPYNEPGHEDQFPEESDHDELNMGVRIKVRLEAVDYPARSGDSQQNPQYPGDVVRPIHQLAQQQ